MFNLFGAFGRAPTADTETLEPVRYTRCAPRHTRDLVPPQENKYLQPEAPRAKVPVAAHRPITRAALDGAAPAPKVVADSTDTNIPISILRKALPLRFAKMKVNMRTDEFVFQSDHAA